MSKAKSKSTPNPPAPPQISGVSYELEMLIKLHRMLPNGNWPAFCDIRNSHGSDSAVGKNVDHIFTASEHGFRRAEEAIFAFPARSAADLAAKLAFINGRVSLQINPVALRSVLADAMRLAQPGPSSDEKLLAAARDTRTAYDIADVLWQRLRAERAEREAAEINPTRLASPSKSFEEANEASQKMGRLVRATFGHKAHTLRGILAKLRLVELAYGTGDGSNSEPPDLETYQRGSWLGATIKDLERLVAGAS